MVAVPVTPELTPKATELCELIVPPEVRLTVTLPTSPNSMKLTELRVEPEPVTLTVRLFNSRMPELARVAPLLTVRVPELRLPTLLMLVVPPETVKLPVIWLGARTVRVPGPVLVKLTAPPDSRMVASRMAVAPEATLKEERS